MRTHLATPPGALRTRLAMTRLAMRWLPAVSLAVTACAGARSGSLAPRLALPASVADTVTSERLADGIVLHHLVRNAGPQRAHVLDIDLTSCVSMRALKSSATAVGRQTTSALLQSLPTNARAIAAVNADFFLFTPAGVPVGALVSEGAVIAGPVDRPVLAFDAANRPYLGALMAATGITGSRGVVMATSLNRPQAGAPGIIDARWAQPLDTLVRPTARLLVSLPETALGVRYRVTPMPAAHSGQVAGDTLVLVGRGTVTLPDGDTVTLQRVWVPMAPQVAVGGFPMLLRDSTIVGSIETDGAVSFRGVNPRTAAGITRDRRHLLLVVIDGRQPSYSVGTTTRETAELLLALGAVEALNLDGGGSTAMVVRDAVTGATRLVNRPSDAAGERPVGDALAVTRTCGGAARRR